MARVNIEKLLAQVDIFEVAERLGMTLRHETVTKKKALCPFHDDKTPSLLVDASRSNGPQHYHCFACGAHGDVIDLVKGVSQLDFAAAVRWLEAGFAISFTNPVDPKTRTRSKKLTDHNVSGLERGYTLYKAAADSVQLETWAASRQHSLQILNDAGILVAPDNSISKQISKLPSESRREIIGTLEDAGLLRKLLPSLGSTQHLNLGSAPTYQDALPGDRVIIPVYDEERALIGVAGRLASTTEGGGQKYLFTRGFPKNKVLYRSPQALNRLRALAKTGHSELRLYIVEGFLDALRLESHGLCAVAAMGVALSNSHIDLLQRFSNSLPRSTGLTVCICFDRDEAGLRGASSAILKLLAAGLDAEFVWPSRAHLAAAGVDLGRSKDPDEYLAGLSSKDVDELLRLSTHPPGIAILANEFGTDADELIDNTIWEIAQRSRKYRVFEKTLKLLEKISGKGSAQIARWIQWTPNQGNGLNAATEFVGFSASKANFRVSVSDLYITNTAARLNHARLLAYMGSRRGELPCDEPAWERLDVAATAFNVLLEERLASPLRAPIAPYEAVWVPRSFGGDSPRLKAMPQPEDLVVQQYLLNEILTERWDSESVGAIRFSEYIPAVRYYREEKKTVTTGLRGSSLDSVGGISTQRTLSFAYQLDMEVIEGRQPATDQGMFRPFHECWLAFMRSIKEQSESIGYVHVLRLDASRYYDRLRRHVVRDSIQPCIEAALQSLPDGGKEFAELTMTAQDSPGPLDKAALVVESLSDLIFGYEYLRPDNSKRETSEELRGIPQGPVLSAWIGSVALFAVDEEAQKLMNTYNTEEHTRVGYARYVDDIVLIADSASILEEVRKAVDYRARTLDITLIAKADSIPPMSAKKFIEYTNQGRALAASGPAWEPPLVGDGNTSWEFWSSAPLSDRQSALHLLSNFELYKSSADAVLSTVRTAFTALDLRASELAKGARLLWYAVAAHFYDAEIAPTADEAWEKFERFWEDSISNVGWHLDAEKNPWEATAVFALEGLEKLIDHRDSYQPTLTAPENFARQQRILLLAKVILVPRFGDLVLTKAFGIRRQAGRRLEILTWKASKAFNSPSAQITDAERALPVKEWKPFAWLHGAVSRLQQDNFTEDPMAPYVARFRQLRASAADQYPRSALLFEYLLASDTTKEPTRPISRDEELCNVAVQTLVTLVPKQRVLRLLFARPHLLGSIGSNLLVMPPLPGVSQKKIIACEVQNSVNGHLARVTGFEAFEVRTLEINPTGPSFLSSNGTTSAWLKVQWSEEEDPSASLHRLKASLPPEVNLEIALAPTSQDVPDKRLNLRSAASMFRGIAQITAEYEVQNEGWELIPAWPFIAVTPGATTYYLLCEGVVKGEVANRAFVRDGGRALRTVEVPRYEARLWRIGMALTDYFGFHEDIAKLGGAHTDLPLSEANLADPSRYVLRNQLRKLRGTFADSNVANRMREGSSLPASIERALQLLEEFPEEETRSIQLAHVLATEIETSAMRRHYQKSLHTKAISVFLRDVVSGTLAKLPLSIGVSFASDPHKVNLLRRDFAGVLALSRQIWAMQAAANLSPAWKVLRAGVICTGITIALQGVLASMKTHGAFQRYEGFDFPSEWGIAPTSVPLLDEPGSSPTPNLSSMSLLELLRAVIGHLGHRMRLNENQVPQIDPMVARKLEKIAKSVATVDTEVDTPNELLDWPYTGVTEDALRVLSLELLEEVAELVTALDHELHFQVIQVREQSYGFNASSRKFTDSKGRAWETTPGMITQFPSTARHVESEHVDGRVLRVWSEVYDLDSDRLLSVSVLGEPFASIALEKSTANVESKFHPKQVLERETLVISGGLAATQTGRSAEAASISSDTAAVQLRPSSYDFRNTQRDEWRKRGEQKNPAHIRVAILQIESELSYKHPMVEVSPLQWPMSAAAKKEISRFLQEKPASPYASLLAATASDKREHLWKELNCSLPSWAEHRRRKVLARAIDSCEAFGVDLLVLAEYSVRPETIEWLKKILTGKQLAVLAGTYMVFQSDTTEPNVRLSAKLDLLWPVPTEILDGATFSTARSNETPASQQTELQRGPVLQFSRFKKYRSVGLNEFIRPATGLLSPLFVPGIVREALHSQFQIVLNAKNVEDLLAHTPLPLVHFMELICSEIFLVTSPANYPQMAEDYKSMLRRFGQSARSDEVWTDVKALAQILAISGDSRKSIRRSILLVPAATTRTADYWIAGQAGLLAGGTTTVFCNGVGAGQKGGSAFIGRESWKNGGASLGYVPSITPYHGWSKGIYYNSEYDPLGKDDQALVIADIDPHNMLEGRPKPQILPVPLQLVAYLPMVELVDEGAMRSTLSRTLGVGLQEGASQKGLAGSTRFRDAKTFWSQVADPNLAVDFELLEEFSRNFSDSKAVLSRCISYRNNGNQQPFGQKRGIFSSPALYDWIDVDLVADNDELPSIGVPPWAPD